MDHRQPTALDVDVLVVIQREGPMGEQTLATRLRRADRQELRYAILRLLERGMIRSNVCRPNQYEPTHELR
jgi:DNA-binding Lrp family transcriptional regulator